MSMEDMRFSQMTTFGDHLYRREGERAEIIMENTRTGIRKTIVDDNGVIMNFPGIAHQKLLDQYYQGCLGRRIRFRSGVSKLGEQYALIWQIQPDGRYWEDDDGFGMTTDDEINLYAHFDEKGRFTEPFYIYSIGSNTLYGTDAEEQLIQTLRMRADPLTSLRKHVPEMLAVMRKLIEGPEKGSAQYAVPGTIYQAVLTLREERAKWYVRASMQKRCSDTSLIGFLKFAPLEEQRNYLSSPQALEDAEYELTQLFYQIQRRD